MRFQLTTLFLVLLMVVLALAKVPKKSVLVTYPKDTPSWIIEKAKDVIVKTGGVITHDYSMYNARKYGMLGY